MIPQEEFNPQAGLEQALADHAYAEEWKNRLLAMGIGGALGLITALVEQAIETLVEGGLDVWF